MIQEQTTRMFNQSYQITSPAWISGNDGLWLSPDNISTVGLRCPSSVANNYQIVLPSLLPPAPNNYYLGLNQLSGNNAFTEWLPASGKIPWSVAQPGTVYESISEYTSLPVALSDAGANGSHISVLVLPGFHDATPNVQLPLNVDLIGWGANVSTVFGEVFVAGPYSLPPPTWYIQNLSLINSGKGNVALRATNSGSPINNGGVVYVDSCILNSEETVRNDDGAQMAFKSCQFDSSGVCFSGTNGGGINLFDCIVLTQSGGIIMDVDGQRFISNWSGFFNAPGNTDIFVRNEELRLFTTFLNIDSIVLIDADLEMNNSFAAVGTRIVCQRGTTGGSLDIRSSRIANLQVDALSVLDMTNCWANSITSNSGFEVKLNDVTVDRLDLTADAALPNKINASDTNVNDYCVIRGKIDSTSQFIGCKLLNNISLQVDQSSQIEFYQNYLNHIHVDSPATSLSLSLIQNVVRGDGPLFNLNMNPADSPLFLQNTFVLFSNLAIADAPGTNVLTQNNISSPSSFWNTGTIFPGWVEL